MEVKKEEKSEREEIESGEGIKIDLAFVVFIIKLIRTFHQGLLPPKDAQMRELQLAKVEQQVIDMTVKFFEENKGKSFSEFLKKEEPKTADNMVVQ